MQFINLHTHKLSNSANLLEVVNQYPWEFNGSIPQYSIGIHPWYINEDRLEIDLKKIKESLLLKECLALGECGLDKRIDLALDLQTEVFKKQLVLVKNTSKPVILHCVAAYQEVIATKKEMNIKNPMIIHGFSKNEKVATSLLENGFYLSFGKYLLRNPELESVFKNIPNDRFFLETDTMEESLEEVYKKASEIKNIEIEELKSIVWKNFQNVFQINK
jgi:TatD DNase family protein